MAAGRVGQTRKFLRSVTSARAFAAFVLAIAALLFGACTPKSASSSSTVSFKLPSQSDLKSASQRQSSKSVAASSVGSSPWGLTDPATIAEINCFVVFFQGVEAEHSRNTCSDSAGKTVARPGAYYGGFVPGATVELSVPSGKQRTISIVGFKASSAQKCADLKTKLETKEFSAPLILGASTQDLENPENRISIEIGLTKAVKFDKCTGPDFDGTLQQPSNPQVTQLQWTQQPNGGTAGAAWSQQGLVTIVDSTGKTVDVGPDATAVVTLALQSGTGSLAGTVSVTAVAGVADFSGSGLSVDLAGTKILRATKTDMSAVGGSPVAMASSNPISIIAGAAARLAFVTQPSGASSGTAFTQQPVVRAEDSFGNPVTSFTGNVSLAITTNPSSGTLSGVAGIAATAGTATFSGLSIDAAGAGYVLTASSTGLTSAASNAFAVSSGAATQLVFQTQPIGGTADSSLAQQPVVAIKDASGNTVTSGPDSSAAVTISLSSGTSPLNGTLTVNAINGIATFTDLSLSTAGAKALTATATLSSISRNVASSPFTIAAGSATQLVFQTQPGGGSAGAAWTQQPVVHVMDSSGNLVTTGPDSTASVTLALSSGTGALAGTAVVTAVGGIATFTGLSLSTAGAGKALSASATLNSVGRSAMSSSFTINPGAASYLAFGVQPSNGSVNSALPSVTVVAKDSYGNVASSFAGTISLAIGTNPGAATLSGTLSVGAASGSSTFTTVVLDEPGAGYTLTATSSGLSSATSTTFDVTVPLTISPTTFNQTEGSAGQIHVSGGVGPYTFTVMSGPGTVHSSGLFKSTTTLGTSVVRVTDSSGVTADATFNTESGGTYDKVYVGYYGGCALDATGNAKCWGWNVSMQGLGAQKKPIAIQSGTQFQKMSSGYGQTCGITTSGALKCWGYNPNGEVGNGSTSSVNVESPFTVDSANTYSEVAAGYEHTCGITTAGVLKCWGLNSSGQLGDGTAIAKTSPTVIDSGTSYVKVAAGQSHTCAITSAGVLKCWGANTNGQLGTGNNTGSNVPVVIDTGIQYLRVATRRTHTCGITTANVLKCWGLNLGGRLGDGTTTSRLSPTVINTGTSYQEIVTGNGHTCGLASGTLKCWGQNQYGEIGNGSVGSVTSPAVIDSGVTYTSIGTGDEHTCGVTNFGALRCWGRNMYSQLGNDRVTIETTPVIADTTVAFNRVESGTSHSCAISTAGKIHCWGSNNYGQIGDGTIVLRTQPTLIDGATDYIDVTTGTYHSCGITSSQQIKCWGYNLNGQLGDGTSSTRTSPVLIDSGTQYIRVVAGSSHTCGITTASVLKCWGQNGNGQLGLGNTTSYSSPQVIDSGVSYQSVGAGYQHTCAVTTSGVLKCWGANNYNQLGNGNTTQYTSPQVIDGGTSYSTVDASDQNNCGLTAAGALKCWGWSVGFGGFGQQSAPTTIMSGTPFSKVSVGRQHTCGITADNRLRCFGFNESGEIGAGHTSQVSAASPFVSDPHSRYQTISAGYAFTCGTTLQNVIRCWGDASGARLGTGFNPELQLAPGIPNY